jgi:hypothetical protein
MLLVLVVAAGCGPGRDPAFFRIVQFSAVDKLQLAGSSIYFEEGDGLKRIDKAGGMVQVIHSGKVTDFAVATGHAYAATEEGVRHYTVAGNGIFSGGELVSSDAALAIAADDNGVSWVTCTTLTHAAPGGTGQLSVPIPGTCAGTGTRLALDSSTAYGVSGKGEWYAARSGGPVTLFANEPCKLLAAGGGWLYCGNGAAGLVRFSPVRREVEQVLQGEVHSFAIGEARIYAGIGEDLVSSPRNSTQVEVLGTYADISAIALDSTSVYFVNTEGSLGLLLRTSL